MKTIYDAWLELLRTGGQGVSVVVTPPRFGKARTMQSLTSMSDEDLEAIRKAAWKSSYSLSYGPTIEDVQYWGGWWPPRPSPEAFTAYPTYIDALTRWLKDPERKYYGRQAPKLTDYTMGKIHAVEIEDPENGEVVDRDDPI